MGYKTSKLITPKPLFFICLGILQSSFPASSDDTTLGVLLDIN